MTPVIRISDETFARLQQLATPFVDTPDTVIARLLDLARSGNLVVTSARVESPTPPRGDVLTLNPDLPESLTHTRVRSARFGEEAIHQPNWNKLLRVAHEVALKKLGSVAALRQVSGAHIKEGQHVTEGFSYIPGADISIQGLDSNTVWQYSLKLARRIGVPIEVTVEWYNKPEAAHPGETARLEWSPE